MNKIGLALLALSTLSFGQGTQPQPPGPQTAKPPVSIKTVQHSQATVASAPTAGDMYCSGFITTDRIPENHYIVGGQNSPEQIGRLMADEYGLLYETSPESVATAALLRAKAAAMRRNWSGVGTLSAS